MFSSVYSTSTLPYRCDRKQDQDSFNEVNLINFTCEEQIFSRRLRSYYNNWTDLDQLISKCNSIYFDKDRMLNWKPKIKVYAFGNLCAGKALYQNEEKLFLMVLN